MIEVIAIPVHQEQVALLHGAQGKWLMECLYIHRLHFLEQSSPNLRRHSEEEIVAMIFGFSPISGTSEGRHFLFLFKHWLRLLLQMLQHMLRAQFLF